MLFSIYSNIKSHFFHKIVFSTLVLTLLPIKNKSTFAYKKIISLVCSVFTNLAGIRDQKKAVDRKSRLIPRKIKETIHSLKNPNHMNKISCILSKKWLPNLQ